MSDPTTCDYCDRERTPADFDYSPVQAVTGAALGWYSGSDGELCPECFTRIMRRANK